MSEGCSPFRELLAAHALQALDAEEQARVEAHLRGCPDCRQVLAEYQQVALGLLEVPGKVAPPARVRGRLIARLEKSRATPKVRPAFAWAPFAVGAVILAFLFVNAALVLQVGRLQSRIEHLAAYQETDRTSLALATYPDSRVALLQGEGVGGTILYIPERSIAVLHIWGLPEIEMSQVYQAWLIEAGGGRQSAGTFSPTTDLPFTSVVLHSSGAVGSFTGVGVTLEPEGGSQSPTGPRILSAEF